jgi:hypothetical protein
MSRMSLHRRRCSCGELRLVLVRLQRACNGIVDVDTRVNTESVIGVLMAGTRAPHAIMTACERSDTSGGSAALVP